MSYALVKCTCNKKVASLYADSYFREKEADRFLAQGYVIIYDNELDTEHEWAQEPCKDCNCPWSKTFSTSFGFKKI